MGAYQVSFISSRAVASLFCYHIRHLTLQFTGALGVR